GREDPAPRAPRQARLPPLQGPARGAGPSRSGRGLSARSDAKAWAAAVRELADARGLRYEPVGGLNPRGAPAALCPGGSNRITGELDDGFFGASCDADEREEGGLLSRAVLPGAVLMKAHMPD